MFFKQYVWDDKHKTKRDKEKEAEKGALKAEAFREKVAEKVNQEEEEGEVNQEVKGDEEQTVGPSDSKVGGGYYYAHDPRGDGTDAAAAPEHRPLEENEIEKVGN